jgi:hypothetical protein
VSLVGATRDLALVVEADKASVAAFAASLDTPAGRVPTTYPIRWLTRPEIVAVVAELAADRPGTLPVHELQTVEMASPLPIGQPLNLKVSAARTDAIHVTVEAEIRDGGTPVGRMHAVLRLMP